MKIDLSDPLKDLTAQEADFVDCLLYGSKMTEMEWESRFGTDLQKLRNRMDLRRISSNIKLDREKRKHLIDHYKLDQIVKGIPVGFKKIIEICQSGKEHNSLSAAQTLVRPAMAYLEKHGIAAADIDLPEGSDGKTNIVRVDEQDKKL